MMEASQDEAELEGKGEIKIQQRSLSPRPTIPSLEIQDERGIDAVLGALGDVRSSDYSNNVHCRTIGTART